MQQTWKPTVGGILAIISGSLTVLTALVFLLGMAVPMGHMGVYGMRVFSVGLLGIPFIVLGIVAIAGGIFALRRRQWGFALAGSICAILTPWALLGILATVFVAISRDEFSSSSSSGPATPSV